MAKTEEVKKNREAGIKRRAEKRKKRLAEAKKSSEK